MKWPINWAVGNTAAIIAVPCSTWISQAELSDDLKLLSKNNIKDGAKLDDKVLLHRLFARGCQRKKRCHLTVLFCAFLHFYSFTQAAQ